MEKLGIGRPSTYASVLDVLKTRGYSKTVKRTMFPTPEGMELSKFLTQYFGDMISVDYTSEMEKMLDEISNGSIDHIEELRKFYNQLNELITNVNDEFVKAPPKKAGIKCEKCGADMVVRKSKYGEFHACSRYPACKHTARIEDPNAPDCPVCGKGKIVQKVNKKGNKFYACNAFPNCKNLYSVEDYNKTFVNKED